MTHILDGKKVAQKLKDSLKTEIEDLKNKFQRVPGLAVIQVGEVAASSVYVKAKTKAAKEVGIKVFDHHLAGSISQQELLDLINNLNNKEDVNGILVQLPLPKNINEQLVLDSIHPESLSNAERIALLHILATHSLPKPRDYVEPENLTIEIIDACPP